MDKRETQQTLKKALESKVWMYYAVGASVSYLHRESTNSLIVYPLAIYNEGTKVQNPRRLCHVYGNLAQTKALRSLLPTLSQSGTA